MNTAVLILGPPGCGKSTIVRQVMSLYAASRRKIPGGVGNLPLGYDLVSADERKLCVIGNYDDEGRASYGMDVLDRWSHTLQEAISCAVRRPVVLMEDGIKRVGALSSPDGREFASKLHVVMMHVPRALCELGLSGRRKVHSDKFDRDVDGALKRAEKIRAYGASVTHEMSRAATLAKVRSLLGAPSGDAGLPRITWR